ncbi:MAG: endonuclease G [Sphingobacteriales bacterium]|jgi:endonuclease G
MKYFLFLLFSWPIALCAQDSRYVPFAHYDSLPGFLFNYNDSLGWSTWVGYELTPGELVKNAQRKNYFKPWCKNEDVCSPMSKLYKGSGYDRGHMFPAGDAVLNQTRMDGSFFTVNISPQHPGLNRVCWRILEEQIRERVRRSNSRCYIITGPIPGDSLMAGRVNIPLAYFKAIFWIDELEMDGYLISNNKTSLRPPVFRLSMDSLEVLLGWDLFHQLPDSLEVEIEKK